MTYREMAAGIIRIAGEELTQRAEELVPNTEHISDITISIKIPSLTDDKTFIPSIQISTSVYPRHIAEEKIINLLHEGMNRSIN